ncbi:MAG: anti-sigma factor family protein, partial [Roseiflexaceae bacterium]
MRCYDDGALRAYLDDALPAAERNSVAAHIASCAACQSLLEEQHALTAQVAALLAVPAAAPNPQLALARFIQNPAARTKNKEQRTNPEHATHNTQHPIRNTQRISRRTIMRTASILSGPRRGLLAGLAAVVVLLSLLALPPLRAAADQLLQIFRVQKVVFVPISAERINELKQLNFDPKT